MSDAGSHDERARVYLVCITGQHIETGKGVPDGEGTLTVVERHWAYCSAALRNAPHEWKETGGVSLDSIRHADLPVFPAAM